MDTTRYIFMGSDELAIPMLEYLLTVPNLKLCGIFTQPDRPSGRGQKLQPNPIKLWALNKNLPILQPERTIGPDDIAWIKSQSIDFAIVMAFGQLLRQPILDLFPKGAWNLHPSLLPLYRGPCPMEAAILQGDTSTGVALMQMILKMDAGDIVDIEPLSLTPHTTQATLRHAVSLACVPLIKRNINALINQKIQLTPQDPIKTCYIRKLNKQDGYLNFWNNTASNLEKKIRAFIEWPGTFFEYQNIRLKVGKAHTHPGKAQPGEIIDISPQGLTIGTHQDLLVITALQKPGGRMLPISDFLRGFPFIIGSTCARLKDMENAKPLITPDHQK